MKSARRETYRPNLTRLENREQPGSTMMFGGLGLSLGSLDQLSSQSLFQASPESAGVVHRAADTGIDVRTTMDQVPTNTTPVSFDQNFQNQSNVQAPNVADANLDLERGLAIHRVHGQGGTTLWYNGDLDQRNGLANETNSIVSDAKVYDDFIVPDGQTWTVSTVFSNNSMGFIMTGATWEIRQGVSAGNGGTIIAQTDPADTGSQDLTGRDANFGFVEFSVSVFLANPVTLTSGTYFLNVTPIGHGTGRSFVNTTSGANSIGMPPGNNGNSFFNSAFFSANFTPTTVQLGQGTWDFSMGVVGSCTGDTC
jgi:hypothetical protein